MRGCKTVMRNDKTIKYGRFHRRTVLRKNQDGGATYGKSEVYEYTEWGPTRGTCAEFFLTMRRSVERKFQHHWHLHNERVANKCLKYVLWQLKLTDIRPSITHTCMHSKLCVRAAFASICSRTGTCLASRKHPTHACVHVVHA